MATSPNTSDTLSAQKEKQPDCNLLYSKEEFEQSMAQALFHAWTHRSSEYHLYILFSHILSISVLDLYQPNNPNISVHISPQFLFGSITEARSAEESVQTYSQPNQQRDDQDKQQPQHLKQSKQSKRQQQQQQQREKEEQRQRQKLERKERHERRSQKQQQETLLPPPRIPDFARIILDTRNEQSYELLDFYELKPLNIPDPWWTFKAQTEAKEVIISSLEQVYDTAMAAFGYNQSLQCVHAIIVIGAYFTHLVWDKRPTPAALTPIEIASKQLEVSATDKAYRNYIRNLLDQVAQYENRELPDVLCWNLPVFDYHHPSDPPLSDYRRVSLSSDFQSTLHLPTCRFPQLSHRSGFFEVSTHNGPGPNNVEYVQLIEDVLKNKPIEHIKETARSLGHRFDGDPEPTPSPPTSKEFVHNIRNSDKVPERKIKLRSSRPRFAD